MRRARRWLIAFVILAAAALLAGRWADRNL